MKKRILCFGDSNTWGYNAVEGNRYDEDTRWTMRLQKQLGDGTVLNKTAYEVSVGRLTMADNIVQPSAPFVIRQGIREDAPLHYETVATDSGFLSNPQ